MSETRKLAAILAADVAGYSRLTATDEERTVGFVHSGVTCSILRSRSTTGAS